MAEVLVVVAIGVILCVLAATAGTALMQTARQTALDREAESTYQSISRNLSSVRASGAIDDLRRGVKVEGAFDDIPAATGSSRSYGEAYDAIVNILESSAALKSATGSGAASGAGAGASADSASAISSGAATSSAAVSALGTQDDGEAAGSPSGTETVPKWKTQALRIAQDIVSPARGGDAGVSGSNFTIYRIASDDTGADAEKVKNVLLEAGVVSPELMTGRWCVFYAVDNRYDYASVLEVWYTTPEYASELAVRYGEGYPGEYAFEAIVAFEDARADLRQYSVRKGSADAYVGYYGIGSKAVEALPSAMLGREAGLQCFLTVTNAEKLVAHLFCYVPEDDTFYSSSSTNLAYTLKLEGATSGKSFEITGPSSSAMFQKDAGTAMRSSEGVKGRCYHLDDVVLDGLDADESFSRFGSVSGLVPGENVKLTLSVTCTPNSAVPATSYEAKAAPEAKRTVNSLFASLSGGDDAYTARVAYARHLQNLSPAVSGLGIATGSTGAGAGGATPGDGKTLNVVQTQNIYFNGAGNTGDYSLLGANWSDGLEQWATLYGDSAAGDGAPRAFTPIENANIASYTSQSDARVAIEGLVVDSVSAAEAVTGEGEGADPATDGADETLGGNPTGEHATNAGLFGTFAGSTLRGITLVDPVIATADSTTPTSAGGLAGTATAQHLTIENCGLHMSARAAAARAGELSAGDVSWLVASNTAGGLVGHATGDVDVSGSYAATVVEALADTGASRAGGLIGAVDGALTLADSYADCYLRAARVGGLVGTVGGADGAGAFTVSKPCYSAGFTLGSAVSEAGTFTAQATIPSGEGVDGSYTVMRYSDASGTFHAITAYDNGIAQKEAPVDATAVEGTPGNGYYLANVFGVDELDTWPFPLVGELTHYGDWKAADVKPLLRVANGEVLTAEVNFDETASAMVREDDQVTLTMYGLSSGATKTWKDEAEDFPEVTVLDQLYTGDDNASAEERASKRFANQFTTDGFIPGENILLWLKITRGAGTLVYPNSGSDGYFGYITNSLFEYGADGSQSVAVQAATEDDLKAVEQRDIQKESSGPAPALQDATFAAYIATGRHLQNLDERTFGFKGFEQPYDEDAAAAQPSVRTLVYAPTDAVQVRDIDFGSGSAWNAAYGATDLLSITSLGPTGANSDAGDWRVNSYDGAKRLIRNVNAKQQDGYAGLFGQFNGASLTDVYLVDAQAGEDTTYAAGALAGAINGASDAENLAVGIKGCRSYLSDAADAAAAEGATDPAAEDAEDAASDPLHARIVAQFAGGLVGAVPTGSASATKAVSLSDSFAASVVASALDSAPASCGGLVGASMAGNVLAVSSSYADCYLSGPSVGGLVGDCGTLSSFSNSYTAGFASGYTTAAGLAPAEVSSVSNCYSALYFGLPADRAGNPVTDTDDTANEAVGASTYGAESTSDGTVPVLAAHEDATFKESVYGLVKDVSGAETATSARQIDATSSYYAFENVNENSVVWADESDSLFTYVKGSHLADLLDGVGASGGEAGLFATDGESHAYNLAGYFADSDPQLADAYPYPTIEGLPHYGDWLEEWAEDLTGFGLVVHLWAPQRDAAGRVMYSLFDPNERIQKYELGVVCYRKDNLSDFVTLVNPFYLAYLYTQHGLEVPKELKPLMYMREDSIGNFLPMNQQPPAYPNPENPEDRALFKRLIVGSGSVGNVRSTAIETSADDAAIAAEINKAFEPTGLFASTPGGERAQAERLVIPDAQERYNNHSMRRYFMLPGDMSEYEFFVREGVEGATTEDKLRRRQQQTYLDDEEGTVFFAGFGGDGISAKRALAQKRTGFGTSIGREKLSAYIETYDALDGTQDGAVTSSKLLNSETGDRLQIKRTESTDSGRKKTVEYTGEWSAYLEWFPTVSLMTADPDAAWGTDKADDEGAGGEGGGSSADSSADSGASQDGTSASAAAVAGSSLVAASVSSLTEAPDFTTDATAVQQYATDGSGRYVDEAGNVVEDAESAAREDAVLHYVNFNVLASGGTGVSWGLGSGAASSDEDDDVDGDGLDGASDTSGVRTSAGANGTPTGAFYADADISEGSRVGGSDSVEASESFTRRYADFERIEQPDGTFTVRKSGSDMPLLGFVFDADSSVGRVYDGTGQVPLAVVDGGRFIDRDYVAYARYGHAVELVVPVDVTRYDETTYLLMEPDVATGDPVVSVDLAAVYADQVVGYAYYAAADAKLEDCVALELGGNIDGLFSGAETPVVSYQIGDDVPLAYLVRVATETGSDEYEYRLSSSLADADELELYRYPPAVAVRAYATWPEYTPDLGSSTAGRTTGL